MARVTAQEFQANLDAAAWNRKHPVGTSVRYWRGVREGTGADGRTRSEASVLGGTAVVWITGCSGCIALTHVDPAL